jgi:hypothetical protein
MATVDVMTTQKYCQRGHGDIHDQRVSSGITGDWPALVTNATVLRGFGEPAPQHPVQGL